MKSTMRLYRQVVLLPLFFLIASSSVFAQQTDSCQHTIVLFNISQLEKTIHHQGMQFTTFQQPTLLELITRKSFEEKGIFFQPTGTSPIHSYLPVANDSTAVKEVFFSKKPHDTIAY